MTTERRALLSTMWIFVLLNMIFRDIHELFRPGQLAEMMAGTVNGTAMTEVTLLVAGLLLQLQLAMVVLARALPYRVNRWANRIIGGLAIPALLVGGGINDLDDILFTAVEITGLALIVWLSWRWHEAQSVEPFQQTAEA